MTTVHKLNVSENEKLRLKTINLPPEKRRDFVGTITIKIPQFTSSLDLLESYFSLSGKKDPGGVAIFGDSGMGKSYIASHFNDLHPPLIDDLNVEIPILFITLKASIPPKDLLKRLLKKLGYKFTEGKSIAELTDILLDAIILRKVRIIMIDEAQEFAEGNGQSRPAFIGNTLKRLHDESNIPQIYLGVPKNLKRFFNLAEQLAERITAHQVLSPLANDDTFRGLINGFDKALPMEKTSELVMNYCDEIHIATNGNLRRVRRLLSHAVFLASLDKSEIIDNKHLKESYEFNFGLNGNPFQI